VPFWRGFTDTSVRFSRDPRREARSRRDFDRYIGQTRPQCRSGGIPPIHRFGRRAYGHGADLRSAPESRLGRL